MLLTLHQPKTFAVAVYLKVEETVLEELAWAEESPLWTALGQRNEPTPSCEEVFLPSQMEKTGDQQNPENQPKRYAVIKSKKKNA